MTRYRIGWAVPYAVQQATGEARMELRETFPTVADALRAAADMIEGYDVPIGYTFDVTETVTHTRYRITTIGRPPRELRFRAVCECGWQSDPMPTAGLAHAAHDDHTETAS